MIRNPAFWAVLILLIILLFGASKLPDITRNVGKSMKIFKQEVRDLRDDDDRPTPPISHHPNPPQNSDQQHPGEQPPQRSAEHTSELQSRGHLVCRLLLQQT